MLPGVVATAGADHRFEIDLHLVASWPPPPLHELASAIRRAVIDAAAAARLGEALGAQAISFGDVSEPPRVAVSR